MSDSRQTAPADDWKPRRLGANPPQVLAELRADLSRAILAAAGIPATLASDATGDGTSQREAWRRWLHGTLSPFSLGISDELTAKMGQQFSMDFSTMFASDLNGRARAFQSMVKAGMALEESAALAGLMLED